MNVRGPKILFEIPVLGGIPITETILNGWIVVAVVTIFCFILGRNLSTRNPSKRQMLAEKAVTMLRDLVKTTMGEHNLFFLPYVGALFSYSILSSMMGIFGLRAPTGDINTTVAFALIAFFLIQFYGIKNNGLGGWLKGFIEPVPFMLPLNLVGELANPISMAFRHFGNIASGIVITILIYGALAGLSRIVLGWIPVIGSIPFLQVGIPAFLSLYFDLFSSFLQAYIISMLTMVYVGNANEAPSVSE
ncbi:MAG: F0F1 ATP synthase subunit A [Clostridia bacterium]|nr:F0F1 ATP synthase subunit A [Clostridia bacterium]